MLVKTKELSKVYKLGNENFFALDHVSLEIEQGEFVAIQGTSGAGKSTLLQILGCLDTPSNGSYYLNGENVFKMGDGKTAKLRNKYIGFVLQDFSLINYKKVSFNVMLPLYFSNMPIRKIKKLAYDALKAVGIENQFNKKANQLSGGQRQRVAIARAIVNNPSMILADEPTGALDSKTSNEIFELLRDFNKRGITVVVVTHDNDIADKCDRKIVMSDGKIIEDTKKNL